MTKTAFPKARKGEFVKRLATAWGVEESAIAYPMRRLQLAGILPAGKRGFGGDMLTARTMGDAIIAAAMAQRPFDPVELWQRYSEIKAVYSSHRFAKFINGKAEPNEAIADETGHFHFYGFDIPTIQALGAGHTFRDALSSLIEVSASDEILKARHTKYPEAIIYYTFKVSISGPCPAASVSFDLAGMSPNGDPIFAYAEFADYRLEDGTPGADLQIERTFTHQSIDAVACLLEAEKAATI